MNRRNFMKMVGAIFIAPAISPILPAQKVRELKVVWTYESSQDLRSQHNFEAEAELTEILAREINLEIDREIIASLGLAA